MQLDNAISEILEADIPTSFERFGKVLDAQWIEDALKETGTASVRRRKIPAQLVVWLVIGMAMFRDRSINEVVTHLGLVLPSKKGTRPQAGGRSIAPSAVPAGRYRVGASPMAALFERTAETWATRAADQDRWRGLALYGVDGTTLRIPDTELNRNEFGLHESGRGSSAYPQVRLVALMALRSHLLAGAAFGPCIGKGTGEGTLAQELWAKVPDDSLVIVDRGLLDYGVFFDLHHNHDNEPTGNTHWLVRGKKSLRMKTIEVFGDGDELVELPLKAARVRDPSLPETMRARAIRYQVKGYQPQLLLTSLVDADRYPALEIAALYHERWELEIGYDEIKTHMLERQEALRSKKPEGVRQEVWGIALAYNLVRFEMLAVAEQLGVEPRRISFRHTLQLLRVFCVVEAWTCAPANLPKRLAGHQEMVGLLLLPERRSERRYKRHVKIKMSKYKRNRDHSTSKASKEIGNPAK